MRLVDFAFAGVDPEVMGIGPVPGTEAVLARNDLTMDDIGLIGINEAFAVQVLAFGDHFKIADDDPRVNAGEPVGRRDRARPPARQFRCAADDPAGPPVRQAAGCPHLGLALSSAGGR